MRAVKADVTSSKPVSLSKATEVLSLFAASETGAKPDVSAYLRRAVAAFEELLAVHREIRHQRKISQVEQKDDGSHRKKKEKETDCEADAHGRNSLLLQQRLGVVLDQNLGSDPVNGSGVVEGKNVKGKEEEKREILGNATESNGIVENKRMGKKERKKEFNKDEVKSEEVESYGTRSEEKRDKKERKPEAPARVSGERKKRKHSDAGDGRMDGEMEQHDGKKRRR